MLQIPGFDAEVDGALFVIDSQNKSVQRLLRSHEVT